MIGFLTRWLEKKTRKGTIESFRNAKNIAGLPEIEGIETLSDDRIMEIYKEVECALEDIGVAKGELPSLTYKLVDCIVRDRLIDEINGCYKDELTRMKEVGMQLGYRGILVKGRTYSGLNY